MTINNQASVGQMAFRWPWRPYQERILSAIERHIDDRRLHVVAAPGAGKTTLGLEIFRWLGRSALVLSPTRTIRDQWILRLSDFIPPYDGSLPDWVSRDLDAPGIFTSITYQALHTTYRRQLAEQQPLDDEESLEDELELLDQKPTSTEIDHLVEQITAANIKTLILDEAHHLRSEWWKALTTVLDQLPDMTLVSLTATPPYDVTGHEWNRYQELCGPIDEEVSVPELVKVGTLCPHQDFVYAVQPSKDSLTSMQRYQQTVRQLLRDLLADEQFLNAVRVHPWMVQETAEVSDVLDNPELAAALLVFLNARQQPLPVHLLKMLNISQRQIPSLNRRWWQILVKAYLFDKNWQESVSQDDHRDELKQRLRRDSLLYRRELSIEKSRALRSAMSLNPAKIEACEKIYQLEREVRGDGLRQVILTDFIRDDTFVDGTAPQKPELGAWPIFRHLVGKANSEEAARIGLLTGRLAIVHADRLPALEAALPGGSLTHTTLTALSGFHQVKVSGNQRLTGAFTDLLTRGDLHVLVGTRALLGEGWDAPVINSLILASFVGSFMLTNQMRGRAIRIHKEQPDKAASIWHIVATEQATGDEDWDGMTDYIDLVRRFGTFVGLGVQTNVIESGIERLSMSPIGGPLMNSRNNAQMARRLRNIDSLHARWQEAIDAGDEGRVIPSVMTPQPPSFRSLHFTRTLGYLLFEIGMIFLSNLQGLSRGTYRTDDVNSFLWLLTVAGVIGFLMALPRLIKSIIILIRHLPVDGSLREMGKAVRDALHDQELLTTDRFRLKVITQQKEDKTYLISLAGATYYEQSLFADCMNELLGPIGNPRYLITREGRWVGRLRRDYHAVPEILGRHKDRAQALLNAWHRWVGPGELMYTRTVEGRAQLLKLRGAAFSTVMADRSERRDQWQ